jgi:hypothetical protein
MNRVYFIFLLSIAYVSSFGQTLSKEETVNYIKTKLKSAGYFVECYNGGPVIDDILDVKCEYSKLFITIYHTYVDGAGAYQRTPLDFPIDLSKTYVANPTNDCQNYVYEIGGIKLFIDKDDAESIAKAINYLGTISTDPFK